MEGQEDRAIREEAPEPSRPLERRERVALWEMRGALEITNLGTILKISPTGYVHVEWDDGTDGWFSPVKAAALLRRAEGNDALPRHVWVSDIDCDIDEWSGPVPTADEPVCKLCREQQTDENEFGPCFKAKP